MPDYPPYDEQGLLRRIAGGDEKAFAELFYACVDKLTGYIVHITASPQVAEEIAQEVFLKIWLQRETLPAIESLDNYLFILSRNLTFTHLRKLASERKLKNNYAGMVSPEERTTEERADFRTLQELHAKAVRALPPQQQKVYLLSREEGMTRVMIAQALGVGTETVKMHMKLALKAVRSYMINHLGTWAILITACFLKN